MTSSESLVKSSFFDDIYDECECAASTSSQISQKPTGLWIKLKNFNPQELNEKFLYFCSEVLFEGKLMKKSKKHKKLKHKYFVLYKDRIEQYEVFYYFFKKMTFFIIKIKKFFIFSG